MTTYAILVRIEGLCLSGSTQTTFCNVVPAYGDSSYVTSLCEPWPSSLSERADILGGGAKRGGCTVRLLDYQDALTLALATDQAAVTRLDGAITAAATTVVIQADVTLGTDDMLFVGGECIVPGSRSTVTLSSCTRGANGTRALPHADGAVVYKRTPIIRGRKFTISVVDSEAASAASEDLLGTYQITGIDLDDDLNIWTVSGDSITELDRPICAGRGNALRVMSSPSNEALIYWERDPNRQGMHNRAPFADLFSDGYCSVIVNDEVIRCTAADIGTMNGSLYVSGRAIAGTSRGQLSPGQQIDECLDADETTGAFRYSPGTNPSESRSSGTWVASAHFVDIMLCLMTSSANSSDGLELYNHHGTDGLYVDASKPTMCRANWSCLPPGFGLGIPIDQIDVESFIDVRERTADAVFPWTVVHEKKPFLEWAQDAYLRPLGCYLTIAADGRIRLVLPRVPTYLGVSGSLDADSIIGVDSASMSIGAATSITYALRGPAGTQSKVTFSASEIDPDLVDLYYADIDAVEIKVDYGIAETAAQAGLMRAAQRAVLLYGRPFIKIRLRAHYEDAKAFAIGDVITVTHADLPTLTVDGRGWTSVAVLIHERVVNFNDGMPELEFAIITHARNARAPTLCASGVVASYVSGSPNSTITLVANTFSDPDNVRGLPAVDAESFNEFDANDAYYYQTWEPDLGAKFGSEFSIVSIAGNVLTVGGTIGTDITGYKIVNADRGTLINPVSETRDAWMADGDDLTILGLYPAQLYGDR